PLCHNHRVCRVWSQLSNEGSPTWLQLPIEHPAKKTAATKHIGPRHRRERNPSQYQHQMLPPERTVLGTSVLVASGHEPVPTSVDTLTHRFLELPGISTAQRYWVIRRRQ